MSKLALASTSMDALSSSSIILVLLSNVFIIHVAFISCENLNETDRLSLLAFKERITKDPLGALSSWNDSLHHCQWHGVTCGQRHQRVVILDLMSQKLVGSIAPHVGNLSFLRGLDLSNNSFTYSIPQELGRLRRLQYLWLSNNSITGAIPTNISSCSNLYLLGLDYNQLEGEIPKEIGSLSKLQRLYLDNNKLTKGIPPSLGNLSSLDYIFTRLNSLSGTIPSSLGKLESLTTFLTSDNRLSGTLPSSIFNLSFIKFFDVSSNQIQGRLPSNLGNIFPNLEAFSIASNGFTGLIPTSMSNSSNLVYLSFAENKLTGKVPNFGKLHKLELLVISWNLLGGRDINDLSFFSSLTNASNLELFALSNNNFGGTIPKSVVNLSTTFQSLHISGNHLTGTIPIGISNLVHLQFLDLGDNLLTGSIPSEIGNFRELYKLLLNDNNFSGNIPTSLGNLTLLTHLYLDSNNLQGNIPSSLGNCKKLLSMYLSQNKLTGHIPAEVLDISSLSISLVLSDNHLSGSIPTEVGSLKNLGYLEISKNMLSGEIPNNLGSCLSLEFLYMDSNNFQGVIPYSLSKLRGLRELDISNNNLSGPIPDYLKGFDLQYLNLSFNEFEGVVPSDGIFKNKSAVFVNGNEKLCGGPPAFGLSRCKTDGSKRKKSAVTLTVKLAISITSGVGGLCLVLGFICLYRSKSMKKDPKLISSEESYLKVSYQLLVKATDGFSSANMIGAGSFGSVFKGVLDQSEAIVAVKVLNLLHQGAYKSFIAECEALRNVRHRNLVKVLTVCSSVDYQCNDFKAIVYEFMANGNLEKWIHSSPSNIDNHEKLNLVQRLNVANDVACALDYLHHGCHIPIVHCDLKPSNVLLDDEMVAHVGDFGLAKFIHEATQNSAINQSSSVGIRGTIGYTAPEYGIGSEVSTYGDVYSYGILILEMFTGKKPTDEMFKDIDNLHNYVKARLPDRVVEVADPLILKEIEEDDDDDDYDQADRNIRINKVKECLISIMQIGVACSV